MEQRKEFNVYVCETMRIREDLEREKISKFKKEFFKHNSYSVLFNSGFRIKKEGTPLIEGIGIGGIDSERKGEPISVIKEDFKSFRGSGFPRTNFDYSWTNWKNCREIAKWILNESMIITREDLHIVPNIILNFFDGVRTIEDISKEIKEAERSKYGIPDFVPRFYHKKPNKNFQDNLRTILFENYFIEKYIQNHIQRDMLCRVVNGIEEILQKENTLLKQREEELFGVKKSFPIKDYLVLHQIVN